MGNLSVFPPRSHCLLASALCRRSAVVSASVLTFPMLDFYFCQALYKPFTGPADLRIASLKKQIESLDGWQQATLRAVVTLLQKIVLQPDNLMTPPALGTSLGMTLFQGLSVNQATELLVVLLGNEQLYAELEE
eukprot:m.16357 g.16357  ORF g.16357 m.16357 type:complete len:134 (-) comp5240_c0_seq1:176-577(-)